ncbi:hypothetical protein EDD22DRAFT_845148 [Suillus occidentalis]|nr:hypothetical protein EDD22DRAFT_845148 [Suillus occidentalis]
MIGDLIVEIEDANENNILQLCQETKAIKTLSLIVILFFKKQYKVAEYEEFLKEVIVITVVKVRKVLTEKVIVKTDNTPGYKHGAQHAHKVKIASLIALFKTEPSQLEPIQDEDDIKNSGKAA